MSLKIDEYLSNCGIVPETAAQSAKSEAKATDDSKKEGDSYIASTGGMEGAIPCENYNDILKVIQSTKAETAQTETSSGDAQQSGTVSEAGGSGGGSESEDETKTEIVVMNGVTYRETTTVKDGVTSVTRTVISGPDDAKNEAGNTGIEKERTKAMESVL